MYESYNKGYDLVLKHEKVDVFSNKSFKKF